MLAEFGNIAPGVAECCGTKDGFSVVWHEERDWFPKGKWDEVCFLTYRDGKISAGFSSKFIDKYRTQYFALFGLSQSYSEDRNCPVEWCDYDDPKGGK
tara:strand:+ start:129 stop:422 length:294 start_codon:yes stop_codon:yes gene_type:complete